MMVEGMLLREQHMWTCMLTQVTWWEYEGCTPCHQIVGCRLVNQEVVKALIWSATGCVSSEPSILHCLSFVGNPL